MNRMKMNKRAGKFEDAIESYLNGLDTDTQIQIWSEFCSDAGNYEERIEPNDEDTWEAMFPTMYDAMRAVRYGDWNPVDPYCWINAHGNLQSSGFGSDMVRLDEVATWCCDNDEDFGYDEIREILDEWHESDVERFGSRKSAKRNRAAEMKKRALQCYLEPEDLRFDEFVPMGACCWYARNCVDGYQVEIYATRVVGGYNWAITIGKSMFSPDLDTALGFHTDECDENAFSAAFVQARMLAAKGGLFWAVEY